MQIWEYVYWLPTTHEIRVGPQKFWFGPYLIGWPKLLQTVPARDPLLHCLTPPGYRFQYDLKTLAEGFTYPDGYRFHVDVVPQELAESPHGLTREVWVLTRLVGLYHPLLKDVVEMVDPPSPFQPGVVKTSWLCLANAETKRRMHKDIFMYKINQLTFEYLNSDVEHPTTN